jgi:DNA-binding MarR family transcriptional regulator
MHDYTQNLGHWIKRYHLTAVRQIDALLKPYGLGRTQWFILCQLQANGQVSQRQLQTMLDIESATLTNLVVSLVGKGWVAQHVNPQDRRSKFLSLTPQGAKHLKQIPDPIEVVKAHALRGIPAADIKIAKRVIEQAVDNLQNS